MALHYSREIVLMIEPVRGRTSMCSHPPLGTYAAIALLCSLPLAFSCGGGGGEDASGHNGEAEDHHAGPTHPDADIVIPPRTPQLATFPCVEQCHKDRLPDSTVRPLREFHSAKHIEHGDTTFWCNFCHNFDNLDTLHLLDGRTATFDESHRLCGECHGDKRRDWALGIHGLQTGYWNGEKTRRTCTACHDPHAPRRPRFEALAAPNPRIGAE